MSIRITGGVWRNRLLDVPDKGVRPTQDKVRAAVFSSLQAIVPGARVLDLFAGTGAFGLEAVSRGAAFACFVENSHKALACLEKNTKRLFDNPAEDKQKWLIVKCDVERFLAEYPAQALFDVIFADPPYDFGGGWTKKILCHLAKKPILRETGFLIIEDSAKSPLIETDFWRPDWKRIYGKTRLCRYKRK